MGGQMLVRNPAVNVLVNFGATASAYSTGQVIGTPQLLIGSLGKGETSTLISAMLIDRANQKLAVDVYFFNGNPASVGADKAAYSLSVADSLLLVGRYSFLATQFSTASATGAVSEATVGNLGIGLVSNNGNPVGSTTTVAQSTPNLVANSNQIYAVAVARGAPTYGANGLYGRFSICMD